MRFMPSVLRCAALSLGVVFATSALAADELQLIESINSYRSQPQRCGTQASNELPPLSADPRLRLPASGAVDLQQAMTSAHYPMVNVQAITLNGPRDAAAAMQAIKESFCKVVLDPQFVDIGVNRVDRDWRIVLARPLLTAKLGDAQSEGQKLLAQLNTARGGRASAAGSPSRRQHRWRGMPRWARSLRITAATWPTTITSTTRTATAARRATAPSCPVTVGNWSARTSPPGKTPSARSSTAGSPAPGIAPI